MSWQGNMYCVCCSSLMCTPKQRLQDMSCTTPGDPFLDHQFPVASIGLSVIDVQRSNARLFLSPICCWQVLDQSVRDRIPNTVRWFTTLAQHQHFASALGPVSMAAKPYVAAGAGAAEPAGSSSSSRREGGGRKQKEGKKGKDGKQKAALPNGGGPGEHREYSECKL